MKIIVSTTYDRNHALTKVLKTFASYAMNAWDVDLFEEADVNELVESLMEDMDLCYPDTVQLTEG